MRVIEPDPDENGLDALRQNERPAPDPGRDRSRFGCGLRR